MASNPSTRLSAAVKAQQAAQAFQLKIDGYSDRQIADELGVSTATANRRVHEHADSIVVPLAEQWRKLEVERLQMVINRLSVKVDCPDPDLPTLDRYLKAVDLLAKYTGAQQPVRTEVTLTVQDQEDVELAELIRDQRARDALSQNETAVGS